MDIAVALLGGHHSRAHVSRDKLLLLVLMMIPIGPVEERAKLLMRFHNGTLQVTIFLAVAQCGV